MGMTKEELKELGLSDELADKIYKDFVPKGQFNAKNQELKSLKERVEKLTEENNSNKELKDAFTKLKEEAELKENEYNQALESMKKQSAIDRVLQGANVRNAKALQGLIDWEQVSYQDGKLNGLDEQLTGLRESDGYLFNNGEVQIDGVRPSTPPNEQKDTVTKEMFNKMTYTQKEKLYLENNELYEELTKGE